MKIKNSMGIILAACLIGAIHAQAQTTNSTQQILQMQTFREGLVLTGNQTPSEAENKELLEVLQHLDEEWWTAGVEQFLRDHPNSPWAISLRHDYASFCRRTGRTTQALAQWEAAWTLAKNDASPQGQKLAGTVLANWMDLLSSLGRLEKLKELVAVGDQWHFVNAQDRDMFQGAKNSFYLMQEHPGIAYRCGTFALKAVGLQLQPDNHALENLVELASPTNGFSMAALVDMAKQYNLNMVAVRRSLQTATGRPDLIVPSVVHWRQSHYAAILEQQGDLYLVNDPTFGQPKWMPAGVINEEASGEFLIPVVSQTNGWTLLARNETEAIHGMGLPNNVNDGKDKGCGGKCATCPGMPVWWVSEPYVNLWMADEPISYVTSLGEPLTFRITYKQRDSRPAYATTGLFPSLGWNNSWLSYVHLAGTFPCTSQGGCFTPQNLAAAYASLYLPGGGEVDFSSTLGFYDKETRLQLLQQGSSGALQIGADYGNNGLRLVHADGSQDIYGDGIGTRVNFGDYPDCAFVLTRHIDAHGNTTWFNYSSTNTIYVLSSVVDCDGRTNTLKYTGSGYLSEVDNPYGLSAKFKWDASNNLTNLVDAAGMSSSITYDTNGYPTTLVTPYGTTRFAVFVNATVADTNNGQGNFGGHNLIDRAVQVIDPIGANSLYLYRYDCSAFMSTTFSSGDVPTGTPLGTLDYGSTSSTNALAAVCYRNSFYWGPRQYDGLSTTNMSSFAANDFIRGRMRHWLQDGDDLDLSGYVSVERDPSPDGSTEGLKTFYDYQGKVFPHRSGTNGLPSVSAWRLPNGETHYQYSLYDYFGNTTNRISTYTQPNGSAGTRTNKFIFANNTYTNTIGTLSGGSIINTATTTFTVPDLLTQEIGADGNPIWSYGGFDVVTWTNYFITPTQTNGVISSWKRVLPRSATNGVGQVATTTFTGFDKISSVKSVAGLTTTNTFNSGGFLAQTIDLEISRTNSFGYSSNGLVGTFTNELGLNLVLSWDNLLRRTATSFPDGTYTSNRFDKLDLGGTRDRLGNWTTYGHDGARHLTAITNANNAVTLLSWCDCGALTAVLDALNHATSLYYDNQGNPTNITFADASALNYQYDLAARPAVISDGASRFLQLGYNNQSLVTTVSNANGKVLGRLFDVKDRAASVTDENNVTVTNTFDGLDQVLTRIWPDGIGEGYGYSPQGLAFYTNRDNQVTQYGRNAAGWLMAETNANGEASQVSRNPAGDIISLIDGLNHMTTWQFNQFDWLTNKVDGLGRNAFRYLYNPNGWMTNRWTPEKGNTGYTRDNVGNVTALIYPQLTISNAYDALNELTNMVDAVGTHNFGWTPSGQLASEDGPWASDTVSNTFAQGLRTLMILSQPGTNWTQSFAYDSGWRLTNTVSQAGGFIYNFQSALLNAPSSINLPNGAYITNSYDPLARLRETDLNNHWGHTLDGYAYQVDPLGLRTNFTRNFGLTTNTVQAGFDNIGQVASWSAKEASGTLRQNEQLGWNYDAADNLHTRTNGALVQAFTTDAANQLNSVTRSGAFTLSGATPAPATSLTVNGQAAQTYGDFTFARTNLTLTDGNNTFTNIAQNAYSVKVTNTFTANLPASVNLNSDNNGSLTNDGTRSFGFDAENQMTNITVVNKFKKDFVYDGLNRLRIKREYGWTGSAWTKTNEIRFVWDGDVIIQLRDSNNVPTLTLTRGLDVSGSLQGAGGIGGLLAMTEASGVSSFYHSDGSGNVTALMDASENIVGRRSYEAFGRSIFLSGKKAGVNPFWFSSQLHDEQADTYHFEFRVYLPSLQRWANNDPIQEAGGINLYRFVGNSPLNLIDPFGLDDDDDDKELDRRLAQAGKSSALFADLALGREEKKRHDQIMCEGKKALADGAKNAAKEVAIQVALGMATEGFGNAARAAKLAKDAEEAAKAAKAAEDLKGTEAARAALGKGPLANPGAPLTDAMRKALQDNLAAAQNNLKLAQQGLSHEKTALDAAAAARNAANAQRRVDEIANILEAGVQAPKN